ncbi:MAG: dTDP-4-amino-4,6-dideoxygalactose transaminase [Alcanivorax sp.]|nr:dTDP-4-amino-4,6-dideoxygalactose transaminase [Alcanivorax sp.]
MIPFNIPSRTGIEQKYVLDAISAQKLCGDGPYSRRCESWFESVLNVGKTYLTPSCTHALELAALLIDIQPGDEVIMPSYTFVSTANAFALRGAKIVFVDIRADTQNLDERLVESAITDRTRAIVPVHYAGISCSMNEIMAIADRHGLYVIEDAAQGMMASFEGRPLGGIGHLGTYSFHETKNYTSGGEGGLLIVNDDRFQKRAEIIREKGTNRKQFLRGVVDKYSWVDVGSSYLPSELQAAYLWGQLEAAEKINDYRLMLWRNYYDALSPMQDQGLVSLPVVPSAARHNGHMFYLKLSGLDQRDRLIDCLKQRGVQAPFHYVPLHDTAVGRKWGRLHGSDQQTSKTANSLLRLPMWYGLAEKDQLEVIGWVKDFFTSEG